MEALVLLLHANFSFTAHQIAGASSQQVNYTISNTPLSLTVQ